MDIERIVRTSHSRGGEVRSELKAKVTYPPEADESELKFEVTKVLESLRSIKINESLCFVFY